MAKITEKYEPDGTKARGENGRFPRACVCRTQLLLCQACLSLYASADFVSLLRAKLAQVLGLLAFLFVRQGAVCVPAAQAPGTRKRTGELLENI